MNRALFGRTPDGSAADLITLRNAHGVDVPVISYSTKTVFTFGVAR